MKLAESWIKFHHDHKRGEVITGRISKITDFCLFVDLEPEIFGIVHLNDLDGNETSNETLARFRIGDTISAVMLSIEPELEIVSLGIKQMRDEPGDGSSGDPPSAPRPVLPNSPKTPDSASGATVVPRSQKLISTLGAIGLVMALLAFVLGSAPFTPAVLLTFISFPLAMLTALLGAWRLSIVTLYFSMLAWMTVPIAQELSVRIDYFLVIVGLVGLIIAGSLYYDYTPRRTSS